MDFLSKLFLSLFLSDNYIEILISIGYAVLIYFIFFIASAVFLKFSPTLFKKIFKIKKVNIEKIFTSSFAKPLSYLLHIFGIYCAFIYMPFSAKITLWLTPLLNKGLRIAAICILSLGAQNLAEHITIFFKSPTEKFGAKNITVISFFTKVGKAIIIVLTIVILLKEFGYDINGLIAGLGLSGLTFALAAQDTASNFFSGLVILTDKPFAIGDWIQVGTLEGVVEEMNFRSCRIRTFDNALIAIPNSKLSGDSVTNWTKMNLRKTKFTIGLVYSTSKETMQKICDEIRQELNKIKEIKQDTILVCFDKFNSSSLDILIQYHSFPINYGEHLALKEKVQYKIMDIIHANDTSFAFDTKTIYEYKL